MPGSWLSPIVFALAAGAAGCVSATFHSKTGVALAPVTQRAVIVGDDEVSAVTGNGTLIGTIDASGYERSNQRDLADKAAVVAAKNGGTHVVVTDSGVVTTTYLHPATHTRTCTHDDSGRSCESQYIPEHTTSSDAPYAELAVYRVDPAAWSNLPEELRPGADDAAAHDASRADGGGLTVGWFTTPYEGPTGHGTSGSVFPTAYDVGTTSQAQGVWIGGSLVRGHHLLAADLELGGGSLRGVAMNIEDGTPPVGYNLSYFAGGLVLRAGERLAWKNFALAGGVGVAGRVFTGEARVDWPAPPTAVFVQPPESGADLSLPAWASVTIKPTCSFGIEGLAEYDARPQDMSSSTPSFSLGVIWQPASTCR